MGKKHPTNIGHLEHILLIDEKSTVISVTDTLLKNKIEMTLKCAIFSSVMLLQYFWLHHFDVGCCWMCLFYGAPGPVLLEILETLLTQSLNSVLVFRILDCWPIVVVIILEVTVHLFGEKIDTVVFCASYACRFLGFCCIPRAKHAEKGWEECLH